MTTILFDDGDTITTRNPADVHSLENNANVVQVIEIDDTTGELVYNMWLKLIVARD